MPNFAGGGAEKVALTLLNGLDRNRFAPELAVFEAAGPLSDGVAPGIPLHDLGRPRLRRALPALVRLIRARKPAAVFATQGYVNLALLAVRPALPGATALVVRESNTLSQSLPNLPYPWLGRLAYRLLYPRADAVICQHRQTEREMTADFRVASKRVQSLPNPVDVAALRAAAEPPLREPGSGLRFVAAGRLTRQKGYDRLLDLMAALPAEARLTIYGVGADESALQRQAAGLGLAARVRFAGFKRPLAPALAGADACLVPSRWEGLPNVALEALACGTPVISSPAAGGIAELAEEAPGGAVTLADLDGPFGAAMRALIPRERAGLRPSLLPARYDLSESLPLFTRTLEHVCHR
jgi:glycosyltransferase involved in cell wall biosynthesis